MSEEKLNRKYEVQFVGFVTALGTSAMQQLGKLMNPMTGKVERNLEAAHATIEMIEMLQAKTIGNLSQQEADVIQNWLTNLRLNYVEELKQDQQKADQKEETPESEAEKDNSNKKKAEKD